MSVSTIIVLVVIVAAGFFLMSIFNRLVALKNRFENAFAQIEVQLKRRYDLIPNLVDTAKGYIKHERETLEAVIEARNQAASGLSNVANNLGDPSAMQGLKNAEGALMNAMGRLNVVMEAYPDLKANENMMQLSEELKSTENKVAFSRQAFNDSATEYNIFKQSFPANLLAASFGHQKDATLLEFEDSAEIQSAPKVSF